MRVKRWAIGLIASFVIVGMSPGVAAAHVTGGRAARTVSARKVPLVPALTPGEGTGKGWCTEYGTSGVTGLYSYDNVWACGPDDTIGPTPFDSNGTASFQCVELSERFLWAIDGLAPIFGGGVDGNTLVSLYHSAHPSIAVGSPGPSSLPKPGDVMSFNEGGDIDSSAGHTAVVVSAPNSSGNFTIMSENWNNTAGEETAHIDMTGGHDGHVQLQDSSFWNAAPYLELKSSSSGYEIAFEANTGSLFTYSSTDAVKNTTEGMWHGTSPSIAALAGGGYETAFQANTGSLFTYSSTGAVKKTTEGMWHGTSPSIAALAGGGYETAFQANTGSLYTYSSTGAVKNTTEGMWHGTSPSIAALAGGGYEIAFEANTGSLYTYSSTGAVKNTTEGMWHGTSPSIAA
jgi:hypothetical protein